MSHGMIVDEEIEVRNVVKSTEPENLVGPNHDEGSLLSFSIKGDLTYRVVTNTDTGEQALVVSAPVKTLSTMAYSLVRYIEAEQIKRAKTRVKKD